MTPGLKFDPAMVAELDEPVRRYFTHALRPGAPLSAGVRLTMTGLIKVHHPPGTPIAMKNIPHQMRHSPK